MNRVLMVDDVAINLKVASETLKDKYEVQCAKSGKQALLMLSESIPDIILLDLNMPQMDGFEVFERIKDNSLWKDIPVIFITAEREKENEVKALSMGAMDFIYKPFEPEVLITRIEKVLDITNKEQELEDAANIDVLTSLLNRKSLEKYMLESEDKSGYFMIFDLDNFKQVNDNYGHMVGDDVLVRVANVFKEVTGPKDRVCRLGGDEFAMFISGSISRDEVKSMVRKLIATCEFEISELIADYSDFKVSVSIGISCMPNDGCEFNELYANADKALYFVKQNGKRGYHFYDTMAGDSDDSESEDNLINLLQLQRLISENKNEGGAYRVEYEGFKRIYRFVARCMDRKNQDVQIVLFTLKGKESGFIPAEDDIMDLLADAVSQSLRRGDVATSCGRGQYVAILMDANEENGKKVADRIKQKFVKDVSDDNIQISYEIQSVTSGNN